MEKLEMMSVKDIESKPNQAHQTIKALLDQREREFERFKLDCRKKALDIAHQRLPFDINDDVKLLGAAKLYYDWLTNDL